MMACECGVEPSTRDLGIEVEGVWDGILIWRCGACGRDRPRFDVPSSLNSRAMQIIENWKKSSDERA